MFDLGIVRFFEQFVAEGQDPWGGVLDPFDLGQSSKTGAYDTSAFLDQGVAVGMEASVPRHPPHCCSWRFTYQQMVVKEVSTLLRLDIVPYHARHSVVSLDRLTCLRSGFDVQRRARWRCVARYEKLCRQQKYGSECWNKNNYHSKREAQLAVIRVQGKWERFGGPSGCLDDRLGISTSRRMPNQSRLPLPAWMFGVALSDRVQNTISILEARCASPSMMYTLPVCSVLRCEF